ncbi:MAG TPA: helix-turn-helix domain-containing protein [Nocardioidaceae bacterium]|nr:helix-turn-helix domain-containing protein [Nocardioidaceae bacterium]
MLMEHYNATVEVAVKDYDADTMMDRLAPHHPAVGKSERGWASATISLPAESVAQAAVTACAVVAAAFGAPALVCVVMTEREFDARQSWASVPDLVSVSEAAELLGVSRQRVLQRIEAKTLPATRVGRDFVIPRTAIAD